MAQHGLLSSVTENTQLQSLSVSGWLCCPVQVIVQTNHMGRWDFNLCDLSATDGSKCTQLQR